MTRSRDGLLLDQTSSQIHLIKVAKLLGLVSPALTEHTSHTVARHAHTLRLLPRIITITS